MKKRLVLVLLGCLVVATAAAAWWWLGGRQSRPAGVHEVTEVYTCPMHPSVRSDRPGACPVCGMALVKQGAGTPPADTASAAIGEVRLSPLQRVLANVMTVRAVRGTLEEPLQAFGTVVPVESRQITVAARFAGRIERLHADVTGKTVARGAPLFEIFSPDFASAQQEYLLARAGGDDGLRAAARERLLFRFGMSAEQIERLAGTTVPHPTMTFLSPLAGTILEKNVREGQYVEEGMTLYQLADLRTVWVVLEVYERDLARVRIGQTARIAVEAYPGSVLTGRVTFVDPVLNPETRTVKVRVEAANTSGMLRPNMYVRGEIALASRQALLVPGTAIVSTGTRSVVWVEVRENVFEPRPVSIGRTGTGRSEILAGLAEGERVAESGGFLLDSESSLSAPAAPAQAHPGHAQGGVVEIHVKGGYTPEVVRVPAGQAVTLRFVRDEDAACSAEVLFPTLGIRRSLAPFAATDILLPPQSAGRVPFTCGMEMLEGTIVVEEP